MGIVVDGALSWYCITCYYFLKVKSLFRSIIFSSLFLGLSAQAKQICPVGSTDGFETLLREKIYITYNGNKYDCFEDTSGAYSRGRFNCGDGRRGDHMEMYMPSKEGIIYRFFGNDVGKNPNDFERIDCSSGSYCLIRTLTNNLARPDEPQIKFNVLISTYRIFQRKCNKLSF